MEVEDMKEHMKNRSIDEELNQQMTERPPRKEYSLRSRKKQSAVLNYVIQVVRSKMVQEQEGQLLNMTQTSRPVWEGTDEISSTGHIIQKKKRESITI